MQKIKKLLFRFQYLLKFNIKPETKELSYIFTSASCLVLAKCFNTAIERHYIPEWLEWTTMISSFVILCFCLILINIDLRK